MRFFNLVGTHLFSLRPMIKNLLKPLDEKGKTLYVPKIRSKDVGMDFLRCYSADDLASFPAGTWGIREPGDLWEEQTRSSSESTFLRKEKFE
jgi:5-formyltetrahydrofolate cyclo-ligase